MKIIITRLDDYTQLFTKFTFFYFLLLLTLFLILLISYIVFNKISVIRMNKEKVNKNYVINFQIAISALPLVKKLKTSGKILK